MYGRDGVLPQWVFSGKEGGWKKMPAKDIRQATIPYERRFVFLALSKPGSKH